MFKKLEGITNNLGFVRKNKIDKELDLEILYLAQQLGSKDEGSEDYEKLREQLKALVEIKNSRNENAGFTTADVLKLVGTGVTAGASILSLMMVLKYESSDEIITSKAFSVASKLIGKWFSFFSLGGKYYDWNN